MHFQSFFTIYIVHALVHTPVTNGSTIDFLPMLFWLHMCAIFFSRGPKHTYEKPVVDQLVAAHGYPRALLQGREIRAPGSVELAPRASPALIQWRRGSSYRCFHFLDIHMGT
jgi:hypothetical protein